MTRYWIVFAREQIANPHLSSIYGVTAQTLEEAMGLLQERVFAGRVLPRPVAITANIDVSALDPKHVLPNIGVPCNRGIWFPNGL